MGHWADEGFVANPVSYYKSAIQQIFLDAFGSDFDLNDNLPQGVLIQRLAELFYGMDMDGIEAFARLNLNTMGGLFLDVVGNLRGITRVLGEPQTGVATITCKAENFIPFTLAEGTVLTCVESGDTFTITRTVTLESNVSNVPIAYTENGNSSAIVGNTMQIDNYPQILNIEIISLFDGTDNESDIAYRSRLQKDYPAAVGTVEFVENLLRALPAVKETGCLYNDTDQTVDVIPPYCTEWIVAPSEEVSGQGLDLLKEAVAEVIVDNKVPGSPTYGNTTVVTHDVFGSQKTVNFTIADNIPIEMEITVATPESTGIFDLSGIEEIKGVVKDYVNNLGIGKDVSYSRCMAPFAADKGFDVTSFKMRAQASLEGADTRVYTRNPMYDTATALAWKVGNDLTTPYYTQGTSIPVLPDDPTDTIDIYSDAACTTSETTIASVDESPWIQNGNLTIEAREYASVTVSNIKVNV